MVATADLLVYNAEKISSLFFYIFHSLTKLHPFFTYEGKKKNWAYLAYTYDPVKVKVQQ